MKNIIALITGVLFGFGLALSGMTNPDKVLGFLDVFGRWQADLAFVMGGALAVGIVGFKFALSRNKPILDQQFHLPSRVTIDPPLITGAAIFGVGWGLYGYCPGPSLASLVYLDVKSFAFVAAMISAMLIANKKHKFGV